MRLFWGILVEVGVGEKLAHLVEAGGQVLHFGQLDSVGEGVAGGADPDGGVGVGHGLGKDGHAAAGEAVQFLAGDDGGLLAEVGQAVGETGVAEPAAEGFFVDAGGAGGPGQGRGRRR